MKERPPCVLQSVIKKEKMEEQGEGAREKRREEGGKAAYEEGEKNAVGWKRTRKKTIFVRQVLF